MLILERRRHTLLDALCSFLLALWNGKVHQPAFDIVSGIESRGDTSRDYEEWKAWRSHLYQRS